MLNPRRSFWQSKQSLNRFFSTSGQSKDTLLNNLFPQPKRPGHPPKKRQIRLPGRKFLGSTPSQINFDRIQEKLQTSYTSNYVTDTIMSLARARHPNLAEKVLQDARMKLKRPKIGAYVDLMRSYEQELRYKDSLKIFELMQKDGLTPDKYVFVKAISMAVKARFHSKAKKLYAETQKQGHSVDVVVFNSLLHSCSQCQDHEFALEILDEIHAKEIEPNDTTFARIATSLKHSTEWETLKKVISTMHTSQRVLEGLIPETTYQTVYACAMRAALTAGNSHAACSLYQDAISNSMLPINPSVGMVSLLIQALVNTKQIVAAVDVFNEHRFQFAVFPRKTYGIVLQCLEQLNHPQAIVSLFDDLQASGIEPTNAIISAAVFGYASIDRIDRAQVYAHSVELSTSSKIALMKAFLRRGETHKTKDLLHACLYQVKSPSEEELLELVDIARNCNDNEAFLYFQKGSQSQMSYPTNAMLMNKTHEHAELERLSWFCQHIEQRGVDLTSPWLQLLDFANTSSISPLKVDRSLKQCLKLKKTREKESTLHRLIARLCHFNEMDTVVSILVACRDANVKLPNATYQTVLNAFFANHLFDEHAEFHQAVAKHRLFLSKSQVHQHVRTGNLEKAILVLDKVPGSKDAEEICELLLSACKNIDSMKMTRRIVSLMEKRNIGFSDESILAYAAICARKSDIAELEKCIRLNNDDDREIPAAVVDLAMQAFMDAGEFLKAVQFYKHQRYQRERVMSIDGSANNLLIDALFALEKHQEVISQFRNLETLKHNFSPTAYRRIMISASFLQQWKTAGHIFQIIQKKRLQLSSDDYNSAVLIFSELGQVNLAYSYSEKCMLSSASSSALIKAAAENGEDEIVALVSDKCKRLNLTLS